jgi:two-component system chemotaxis response regulator CheB
LAVSDAASFAELRRALRADGIEVVGTASTATGALTLTRKLRPDAVLLELELSQMDGLQLLAQLVHERIAPVLAVVSCADLNALTAQALALGASDVIVRSSLRTTPGADALLTLPQRLEALVHTSHSPPHAERRSAPTHGSDVRTSRLTAFPGVQRRRLVAIGASTGGTQALAELLRELPSNFPPVLIVQHMLPEFTHDFAERLNDGCALNVREAAHGEPVVRGSVLIAPGGQHMRLGRDASGLACVFLSQDAPVGKHRPSVDVLFDTCAEVAGAASVGVLLTGMGDDGARGLLAMRSAGAFTIAQDQATSVCFGMPSSAIKRGAAQEVLPLPRIGQLLIELTSAGPSLPDP